MSDKDRSKTLVVNLMGGPGAGKSTNALLVAGKLKARGILAEYAGEYAKDLVYEKRDEALDFQPYVTARQQWRIERLVGEVDCIVTDSPILTGLAYTTPGGPCSYLWSLAVVEQFRLYNNLTFLLHRDRTLHPYQQAGRKQNESEAIETDFLIRRLLELFRIPHEEVGWLDGLEATSDYLVTRVIANLTSAPYDVTATRQLRERGDGV